MRSDSELSDVSFQEVPFRTRLVCTRLSAFRSEWPVFRVDWNAELVRGDLGQAVQQLKRESGQGLFVGGVKFPLALVELGLIDEYEFVVHPRLAGHGPTLFAGLSKHVDLKLVSRLEFASGAVAMRYELRR